MRRVRTAVVGLNRGSNLARHIINFAHSLELVAVCDLDRAKADRFASENNVPNVYYSLDEVLKTDVEAVKTAKRKYMMEKNFCYYRPLTIVQNMIKAGLLGEIYYAESDYLMDFQLRSGFPEKLQPWRKEVYFGRRGHPYITHTLGPLCFTMGSDIKTVTCMGAGKFGDLTADRTCVLMLQTKNGGMIRLRNSFVSSRPDMYTYYSVQGTKGCYQGAEEPTDFHKIHIRGLCGSQEWCNVYDFRGFLPKEWDIYPKDYFDDTKDNGTEKYDVGVPILLEEFAKCIVNNTEPPDFSRKTPSTTAVCR